MEKYEVREKLYFYSTLFLNYTSFCEQTQSFSGQRNTLSRESKSVASDRKIIEI